MTFLDDVIFPTEISKGSQGGPEWRVEITELANGREERNSPWSAPRRLYDARWGIRTYDELDEVLRLYSVAGGALRGFRFLDWLDYKTCAPSQTPAASDQPLGTGDGTTTVFNLAKTYRYGAHAQVRRIHKPFGTVLVAFNGSPVTTGFTVDLSAGTVTFDDPPTASDTFTWGGTFHVPVRFDGRLDQTELNGEYGNIPSIPLKELRL